MNGSAGSKPVDRDSVLSPPPARQKPKSNSLFAWLQSILRFVEHGVLLSLLTIVRLFLWYSVFVVVFRCPSTPAKLTDASPTICPPYLQLKSIVAPYIEPSYKEYLHPYVEKAQPHVDYLNDQVYAPAASVAATYYDTYAAAHVDKAQSEFQNQWAANVDPKLQAASTWAVDKYETQISPHLVKATEYVEPHVKHVQGQLVEIYDTTLIPLYEKTSPHAQRLYIQGHYVTKHVVVPYIQTTQQTVSTFIAGRIWPRLVILYGENVEPQILRITERLGRYKDSKKLTASISEMEAESSITAAAARASSRASSSSASKEPPSEEALPGNVSTEQNETEIREKIESDLKTWQTKFAKAAEKGAEDLGERVGEIALKQINHQAHGVGKALVTELDTSVQSSFKDLKQHINNSITKIPEDASSEEEDAVYEELLSSIKIAGERIRKKAVAVRTWKQEYDNETASLVKAALDSTLDVIDNIRDLGLQEIGMRWAWMEGVTYKDWSKYTDLKKTFDTWRDEVEAVALKHKSVINAKEEGDTVQDQAMEMAEGAAKELKRLKDVAKWKVWSHDSTEDFSSRSAPERVLKSAVAAVGQAFEGGPASILSEASSAAADATSAAQSAAETLSDSVVSLASAATATPKKVWGGAMAENVVGQSPDMGDFEYWTDMIEGILDAAGDRVSDLKDVLSEAMLKPTSTPGHVEVITSLGSEQYARALSAASSALFGPEQPLTASVASVASDRYAHAVTA
jgi:hypothetical protein